MSSFDILFWILIYVVKMFGLINKLLIQLGVRVGSGRRIYEDKQ